MIQFSRVDANTLLSQSWAQDFNRCIQSDAQITVTPHIGDGSANNPYEMMELWAAWYFTNDHYFYFDSGMPTAFFDNTVLTRLITYVGNAPFTNPDLSNYEDCTEYIMSDANNVPISYLFPNDPLDNTLPFNYAVQEPQWLNGNTENWMAWMKPDLSWGVAIYFNGTVRFGASLSDDAWLQASLPGAWLTDNSPNPPYGFYYTAGNQFQFFPPPVVIVGNLDTIRSIVYMLHNSNPAR